MRFFKIKTRDVVVQTFRVEAETAEEAMQKVTEFGDVEEGVELWDEYCEGRELEDIYEEKN